MTEDELLARYGLPPGHGDAPAIRTLIVEELQGRKSDSNRDNGDLLKLGCVQLFSLGGLEDVLLIWKCKRADFDLGCWIDVQLLCGAGLDCTKAYLADHNDDEAGRALVYLAECEAAGDFEEFSPADYLRQYIRYFSP
ncbi:hypothetical protein [Bremerella sp.]|uniref:hypothetical protein n=1 Tax=Bremerella sp. TaxID=2795602 RepID=UPI00391D18F6